MKIDTAVVPGGCTKFVQAPDVCWNRPFKAKIQDAYEDWMEKGEKSYTNAGNIRAPDLRVLLTWIYESWQNLSEEMIIKSFKVCGVSNALDGSEIDLIHCFKEEAACSEGAELVKRKLAEQNLQDEEEEVIEIPEEIDASQDDLIDENDSDSDDSVISLEIW